jgi:hypothetical protein
MRIAGCPTGEAGSKRASFCQLPTNESFVKTGTLLGWKMPNPAIETAPGSGQGGIEGAPHSQILDHGLKCCGWGTFILAVIVRLICGSSQLRFVRGACWLK